MRKSIQEIESELKGVKYLTHTGNEYLVEEMSKGFLVNQIEYINRTRINEDQLPILVEALRLKSIVKFKYIE